MMAWLYYCGGAQQAGKAVDFPFAEELCSGKLSFEFSGLPLSDMFGL